jgi:hypothetical protein
LIFTTGIPFVGVYLKIFSSNLCFIISAIDDVFIRKDLAEGKYKPDFAALKK